MGVAVEELEGLAESKEDLACVVSVSEAEAAAAAPPKPLPLPLEGLLSLTGGGAGGAEDKDGSGGGSGGGPVDEFGEPLKVPRAIVHRQPDQQQGPQQQQGQQQQQREDKEDGEGGAFVLEGGHERLASGGGIRGIRFLRNSQKA